MENWILTRYLYVKEEVKIALLLSILEKKEEALFWAYELYYSGFENELLDYLLELYKLFFEILNPCFEKYIYTKIKEWKIEKKDRIVGLLVNNFLIRPFTVDIYVFNHLIKRNQLHKNYKRKNIKVWINQKDIYAIAYYINTLSIEKLLLFWEEFNVSWVSINSNPISQIEKDKKNINHYNDVLIKIIRIFMNSDLEKGKNLYMTVDDEEIKIYKTINHNSEMKVYKTLKKECKYKINQTHFPNFISLERYKYAYDVILKMMREKWLYYTYETPLWKNRILKYNGQINKKDLKIEFLKEDEEEEFYNMFNYEPDEQSMEIMNKLVPFNIKEESFCLKQFLEKYNSKGILTFIP